MPIVDELGIWEDLGIVEISPDWQFFPFFPKSENSTLRIFQTGEIDLLGKYRNWAYIRASYFSGGFYIFDKWIRVYPSHDQTIIQYPWPLDLIKSPLPQRQFQIKRGFPNRLGYVPNDKLWQIQIWEKQDSPNTINPALGEKYPATVEDTQSSPTT